jgi:type VI secretion system protein ImpC
MQYQVNFGTLSGDVSHQARASSAPFRIAVLGDFSARANKGELETGDELAGRKPLKVDVDNLDDIIERMGIELVLPIGEEGASVEVALTCIDDFHPDELYDNLEVFSGLSGLRQRLNNTSTFDSAAQELMSWGAEGGKKKKKKRAKARGAVVPVNGKLSDFADLVGRPTSAVREESSIDELLKQIVGPYIVPEKDPRQDAMVATVDEALSIAMRAVLHHPDFQTLEALWRSVDFLVRRLETSSHLQLVLYDVTAEEIAADLSSEDALEDTGLFKLLVEQPPLDAHQGAISAVIANYTFEMTPPHADLLGRIAKIAAQGQWPFITALGADCLDLKFDDLHPLIKESWGPLKELAEAAYLGLTVPRFMLRLPYGKKTDPVDPFDFEEFTPQTGLKSMLWGNAAIIAGLLLGEGYSRKGQAIDLGSVMTVGDIPFHYYTDADGDQTALPCTERLITLRKAEQINAQRLMPMLSIQGRPEIRLGSFQAVGGGLLAGCWTAPAAAAKDKKKADAEAAAKAAEAAAKKKAADDDDDDIGGLGDDDDMDLSLGDSDDSDLDDLLGGDDDDSDDDLDALLADFDTEEKVGGDDDEMDSELADLLKDL